MFESAFGRMFSPSDNIGFDPTINQAEFGTPRHSPWGMMARVVDAHGILNYFPTWPYRGQMNFTGQQLYVDPSWDGLYAKTHGYRGIAPLDLQPLITRPYPFEQR